MFINIQDEYAHNHTQSTHTSISVMTRRSILTTIIIPILLISGLIIFLINNRREYPGEFVLTQDRLDFGTVPEWEGQVTQNVIARNTGRNLVNITRIKTGCSYVEIQGPKVIPPNNEASFNVLLDPQFMPDISSTATAILFTDSPKTPQVYLTIVADVKRFATLSAEVCDFGEILTETLYEKHIKLCLNATLKQENIRILPIEHQLLKWKLTPDPNSECYIVNIQLRIPKRDIKNFYKTYLHNTSELFSTSLTIAFPNDRTLTLPIIARIVEPVAAKPESISFGIVKDGVEPTLRFMLISKSQFQVLNLQTPEYLNVVEVTNSLPVDSDTLDVVKHFEVAWNTSKSPTLLNTNVTIETSASHIPIRVSVYGYIQEDRKRNPSLHQDDE